MSARDDLTSDVQKAALRANWFFGFLMGFLFGLVFSAWAFAFLVHQVAEALP